MTDKLAHDEDRHLDVVGDGTLLKRARVTVLVEIEEKFLVLILAFAGALVGDAGGLHDTEVGAQMVNVADVPLAENGDGVAGLHQGHKKTSWPLSCPEEKGGSLIKL